MKIEIEAVSSKKKAAWRAISILLYKLATAESKDVAAISKELRHWLKKV